MFALGSSLQQLTSCALVCPAVCRGDDRPPKDLPVICTSYEIVMADTKYLQKIRFKYIVVVRQGF